MDRTGKVETTIGGCAPAFRDGSFENARFNAPQGVCILGNWIFVADNENHAIRKVIFELKNLKILRKYI